MRMPRFQTVQGRLVALFVAISLPIGVITTLTAVTTYRAVVTSIEASQARMTSDFAIRARLWYRGILRSLVASAATIEAGGASNEPCEKEAAAFISNLEGFEAVFIRRASGETCVASNSAALDAAALAGLSSSQRAKAFATGRDLTPTLESRYDATVIDGRAHFLVYMHNKAASQGGVAEAMVVVAPFLVSRVFDLGDDVPGSLIALATRGGEAIVSRGSNPHDTNWLPRAEVLPDEFARWTAPSRSGESRDYVAHLVTKPDIYVIASFSDSALRAAETQFLTLLLAPICALALLFLVYLRAISGNLSRWLAGIETAARARSAAETARAPVGQDMPEDIRNVVLAFNAMVEEQEGRERRLQATLDTNRFLTRELHHRVKNSLQVVQSYIGLSKRNYAGEGRIALADAECRVHVLSAAYRGALAEGEMRPVPLVPFLRDVAATISALLCGPGQHLTAHVETHVGLPVDRAIPLGLLMVDLIARVLRAEPAVRIEFAAADIDDSHFDIWFEADREVVHGRHPRIFTGLVAQLGATQITPENGAHLGRWRILTNQSDRGMAPDA